MHIQKAIRALLMLFAFFIPSAAYSALEPCGRLCLINIAENYLRALVAHDPGSVPLAVDLKTVENLKIINPGEGLWQSASAVPEGFSIFVPDHFSQQIGFMVVMKEKQAGNEDATIQVAFRLQLQEGKIVAAEHLINRDIDSVSMANLQSPRLPLLTTVPSEFRDSRARLLSIGASYYDALVESNSALSSFADDCVRHENGHQTSRNVIPADPMKDFAVFASMGCAAQLDTRIYAYIDAIDKRRVAIADEETGLVFGLTHFRQAMGKSPYQLIGVPGHSELIDERDSYDLSAVHIFKIWGGKIHEVEAVGYFADYMTTTGWE